MYERTPAADDATAVVSSDLAAYAAVRPRGKVRRIAREIAAGRRTEWLGANVQVRTVTQGRQRHYHFVVASLPAELRAELESDRLRFLVAAEQAVPGAELGPADFMLLHAATQCDLEPELFGRLVSNLTAGGPLLLASRARFDLVIDYLIGFGLRSSLLPEIGPDYVSYLDEARRQVGMGDDAFSALMIEIGGVWHPAQLSGHGFLKVLMHLDQNHGLCLLPPRRHYMNRTIAGQIHHAAYRLNISYAEHLNVLIRFGGGCYRIGQLDQRGARRVLSHYFSRGYQAPEPAPRVSGAPGFISQAQANLIWKLWHDFAKPGADVSEAALTAVLYQQLGIEGGLHALTAAGAGRVLDHMLAPLIALRLAAVKAWEAGVAPAPSPP